MRSWRTIAAMSVLLLTTPGCVTTLQGIAHGTDSQDLVKVHYEPTRGGIKLSATPAYHPWYSPRKLQSWGWWVDALLGVNLAFGLVQYRSYGDASIGAAVGALLLVATDAYFGWWNLPEDPSKIGASLLAAPVGIPVACLAAPYRLLVPEPAPDSSALDMSRVDFEVQRAGESLSLRTISAKRNQYVGFLDLKGNPRDYLEQPLRFVAKSEQGGMLYRKDKVFPKSTLALLNPRNERLPKLSIQLGLEDPLKEGTLKAEIGGSLLMTISNAKEAGAAEGVRAKLKLQRVVPGLSVPGEVEIGDIAAGQSVSRRVPLAAGTDLPDGNARVNVSVEDFSGFDAKPALLSFNTHAMRLPDLFVEKIGVDDGKDGLPEPGEQLEVKVLIRNKGKGHARDVEASLLNADENIMLLGESAPLGAITPGGYGVATYSLFVKNGYRGPDQLPLKVRIKERHPAASKDANLPIALHQSGDRFSEIAVQPTNPYAASEPMDVSVDVDQPLAAKAPKDPYAVAVVIGIERYNSQIPQVPFARRDAAQMREYLFSLFGVQPENMIFLTDAQATKGAIQTALEAKLPALVRPGKSKAYVYYAGHGAPDPETKTPFLVPVDGDPAFTGASCYSLGSFYESLNKLGAKSTLVMLDCCFSGGSGRGDGVSSLLAQARPLFVAPTAPSVPSGVTVLAAAAGNQLSSGYPEKKHGLFTYFLLKGLRGEASKSSRLTLGDIHSYLSEEVQVQARRVGRVQTPVLLGGAKEQVLVER